MLVNALTEQTEKHKESQLSLWPPVPTSSQYALFAVEVTEVIFDLFLRPRSGERRYLSEFAQRKWLRGNWLDDRSIVLD